MPPHQTTAIITVITPVENNRKEIKSLTYLTTLPHPQLQVLSENDNAQTTTGSLIGHEVWFRYRMHQNITELSCTKLN